MNNVNIGYGLISILKELVDNRVITQEDLSSLYNVAQGTISNMLNKKRTSIKNSTLLKFKNNKDQFHALVSENIKYRKIDHKFLYKLQEYIYLVEKINF